MQLKIKEGSAQCEYILSNICDTGRCQQLKIKIELRLFGAYFIPAWTWNVDLSAPRAPHTCPWPSRPRGPRRLMWGPTFWHHPPSLLSCSMCRECAPTGEKELHWWTDEQMFIKYRNQILNDFDNLIPTKSNILWDFDKSQPPNFCWKKIWKRVQCLI